MAVVAGIGAAAGILAAITSAEKVIGQATKFIDIVFGGAKAVAAGQMKPEEYEEAMRVAAAALATATGSLAPIRERMREKDKQIEGGWDPRLDE